MPSYYNSTAQTKDEILASRTEKYAQGGRVGAKKGDWIQDAFANQKRKVPWVDPQVKNSEVRRVRQDPSNMRWLRP